MNKKGLSLIEILISLAILSVIMIMTTPLIIVKTRHNIADTNANAVWDIPQNGAAISLNQTQNNTYPNFIIGATGTSTNLQNSDIGENGSLFVYNNGSANKDLPAINILSSLSFFDNTIDGSNAGALTIHNETQNADYLTLSDSVINIKNQLAIDSTKTNISIGNNIIPDSTTGITAIGAAGANAVLPARNNALYLFANTNVPVVEADNNMIHIKGNLTIQGTNNGISVRQVYLASDKRLKNIKGEYKKGLNEILKINPVEFTYKTDTEKKINVGVIAQDLKKIIPEAVIKRDDGYFAVKESPVFFALLNSVKQLNSNYEKIKNNNDELEKQIALLKLNKE